MKQNLQTIHIDRRLGITFLAAWTSVALAWVLHEPGFLVLGAVLAGIAAFGSIVPPRPRLRADFGSSVPTPTEGDELLVTARITNDRRNVLAEWSWRLPDTVEVKHGETTGFALLGAHDTTKFTAEVKPYLFGLQRIGPMHLRVGDPFGFAFIEEVVGTPHDVRVYPYYDHLKDTIVRSRQQRPMLGRYEISQPGYGMEFYGLREYVHGDRPRDINWKATGRSNEIIVNQHEKETNTEALVLLDVRQGTLVGRRLKSPFAQGCRLALSIADSHLKIQDSVKFMAYGDGIKTDRHTGATRKMQGVIDILVGLEPAGNTPMSYVVDEVLPRLRPHTPVFVVTPLVGDLSVREALIRIKSHGFPVNVFVPSPDWNESLAASEQVWQSMQDAAVQDLRATGIPAVKFGPGQSVDDVIRHLEVMQ